MKSRKWFVIASLLISVGMVLGACGPAATPTAAPAATQAPAMTEAPAATEAPAMTEAYRSPCRYTSRHNHHRHDRYNCQL